MKNSTLNALLLAGAVVPAALLVWPFAMWGDVMPLVLRVIPSLSAQGLLCRVGEAFCGQDVPSAFHRRVCPVGDVSLLHVSPLEPRHRWRRDGRLCFPVSLLRRGVRHFGAGAQNVNGFMPIRTHKSKQKTPRRHCLRGVGAYRGEITCPHCQRYLSAARRVHRLPRWRRRKPASAWPFHAAQEWSARRSYTW